MHFLTLPPSHASQRAQLSFPCTLPFLLTTWNFPLTFSKCTLMVISLQTWKWHQLCWKTELIYRQQSQCLNICRVRLSRHLLCFSFSRLIRLQIFIECLLKHQSLYCVPWEIVEIRYISDQKGEPFVKFSAAKGFDVEQSYNWLRKSHSFLRNSWNFAAALKNLCYIKL